MRVRDATIDDLPALRDLYRRSSLSNDGDRALLTAHPELLELADTAVREGRTRVVTVDGAPAGFVATVVKGDTVELEDLFVDPEKMRRGLGRALIQDVIASCKGAGRSRVEVDANRHATAFYESLGFVSGREVPMEYGTAIRMHLVVEG